MRRPAPPHSLLRGWGAQVARLRALVGEAEGVKASIPQLADVQAPPLGGKSGPGPHVTAAAPDASTATARRAPHWGDEGALPPGALRARGLHA